MLRFKYNIFIMKIIIISFCLHNSGCYDLSEANKNYDVEAKYDSINKLYPLSEKNIGVKRQLNYVICDITSSIDEDNLDKIIAKAHSIVLVSPPGSILRFVAIDKNPSGTNFLDYWKYERDQPYSAQSRSQALDELATICDSIEKRLRYFHYEVASDSSRKISLNSCILRSIYSSHDFFIDFGQYNYDKNIFVLSDMVEQCEFGIDTEYNLNFRKDKWVNGKSYFNQSKEYFDNIKVDKKFESNTSLYVLMNCPANYNLIKYPNTEEIKECWRPVFLKLGFTEHVFMNTGIPPKLMELMD